MDSWGEDGDSLYQTAIVEPLETLSRCSDAAYEKRVRRMLSQVKGRREEELLMKKGKRGSTESSPPAYALPSIHRASLFGSWMCVYYNYGEFIYYTSHLLYNIQFFIYANCYVETVNTSGHDIVTSALGQGYYNEDGEPAWPPIDLATLPD